MNVFRNASAIYIALGEFVLSSPTESRRIGKGPDRIRYAWTGFVQKPLDCMRQPVNRAEPLLEALQHQVLKAPEKAQLGP